MRISIDESKCISSGQCVMTAPSLFDQREDDGIAFALDADPAPELHDVALEAARNCPVAAVVVGR